MYRLAGEYPDQLLRLLAIVNVVRPDLGGGVLFSDLFEGLSERGVDVTVKCAYPYYPEWDDKSGRNGWRIEQTSEGGVTYLRHGLYIPRNPNSLKQRLIYEASFYLSLRRRMPRKGEFDAVMVFCPLVGAVAYAAAVRRKRKIPLLLNVQDLSAQAATAGGIASRGGRLSGFLEWIQSRLFHRADMWTTISEGMIKQLERISQEDIPIRLLPNWMHASLEGELQQAVSTPGDVRSPGLAPVRLLYSGNVGAKQDLVSFCRRMQRLPAEFHFRIQAAGSGMRELREWHASTRDRRFELAPLSDEAGLARSLVEADLYVVTERARSGNSFIPSKLIPAISAGTPILAVCDSDSPLGHEVITHRLGPQLSWETFLDLGAWPTDWSPASSSYQDWQAACKTRTGYYQRDTAIDRYLVVLEELAGSKEN